MNQVEFDVWCEERYRSGQFIFSDLEIFREIKKEAGDDGRF